MILHKIGKCFVYRTPNWDIMTIMVIVVPFDYSQFIQDMVKLFHMIAASEANKV